MKSNNVGMLELTPNILELTPIFYVRTDPNILWLSEELGELTVAPAKG
jgi:hypothetical protein